MASSWGTSWGSSWNNSWGTIVTAIVAATLIATPASVAGSDIKAAILKTPTVIEYRQNLQQLLVEDEELLAIVGFLIGSGVIK
jgi:hypothetical protein